MIFMHYNHLKDKSELLIHTSQNEKTIPFYFKCTIFRHLT